MSARSITANRMALMISVAPAVPPQCHIVHQCHLPVPISATSMPHISDYQCNINATYQCPSELPFSFHLSVPVSAAYQFRQSVLPISASQ
ncbi:unnamed protein product, partial [Staurois parvus]